MDQLQNGILEKQRKNSLLKELFRKSIHICSALVPTLLRFAYIPTIILLVLALAIYSVSEILRLKGYTIPIVSKITETAARKRDENKFVLGPVTLVIGILCTAIFCPLPYSAIGIYALSFGDGLASLTGRMIGHVHIPFSNGKTAAGSLACFTAVFISSFCVCQNTFEALLIAIIVMLIEILPLADFDNLFIPVTAGMFAFWF